MSGAIIANYTDDLGRALWGDTHAPVTQRQKEGIDGKVRPQAGHSVRVREQVERPCRVDPNNFLSSPAASPLVDYRDEASSPRNGDRCGFTVVKRGHCGRELEEHFELLIRKIDQGDISSRGNRLQKCLLSVSAARLVIEFSGDDVRDENSIGDRSEDLGATPAGVQID
jgi:hypothetical protein